MSEVPATGGVDHRALLDRADRADPWIRVVIRSYEFEARHLVELRGFTGGEEVSRNTYVVSPGNAVTDRLPGHLERLEATLAVGASTTDRLDGDTAVLVEVGNGAVSVTPGDRLDDEHGTHRDPLLQ